jgi:hypothetical protein
MASLNIEESVAPWTQEIFDLRGVEGLIWSQDLSACVKNDGV